MYAIKPILEPDVIDLLNKDRFTGDLQGYVLSDGGDLFGWSLFKIENGTTYVLDILAPDSRFLDRLIRASAAFGENAGAEYFSLNCQISDLAKYKQVFFEKEGDIMPNSLLFTPCEE